MLSKIAMNVMTRAVRYRLEDGEELEEILDSYPKLSETEKDVIRKRIETGK